MWSKFFGQQHRQQRLLESAPQGPMRDFYQLPFVESNTKIADIEFATLDFETTGLDPARDHIVSLGLVIIRRLSVQLGSAWHEIVYTKQDMPERSAVIHQITDDRVLQGRSIAKIVPELLQKLRGKVLLVHHADIESGFLDAVCKALYQTTFMMPLVDTEVLAKRQYERRQVPIKPGQLRLYNLRSAYHLPAYKAHNALFDAIATAELFLALLYDICPKMDCRLKDIRCR